MIYIKDLITKKMNKKELTEDEIDFFISSYYRNEISEAQASALMSLMHIFGLSENETAYLVNAMAQTGDELELYRISNKLVDIHPIGGISDKITIILLSILNGLNIPIVKIAGRELGLEDRLSSIEGYQVENDVLNFKECLVANNIAILNEFENMVPVENKIYNLRKDIACDHDIKLIAISIMSQKIAIGCKNIFFEITYGENAYVKTLEEAKILSKYLVNIGSEMLRNVHCCITELNEPRGIAFGNIIEMREIFEALRGNMAKDVQELVLNFGNNILQLLGYKNKNENFAQIKNVIDSGRALQSFKKIIEIRGGNFSILQNNVTCQYHIPIISSNEGYIEKIDVNKVRCLAKYLNAIRGSKNDKIDIGAGMKFYKKIGDYIKKGEIIGYIETNNEVKIEEATKQMKDSITLSQKRIRVKNYVVYEI